MKTSKIEIAERQKRAVIAFCHVPDMEESARAAGSTELELRTVFGELCKKPFSASLEVFDVNKPFLAKKCQELLNHPKTKPADKITLMKLLLKTMGEATEEASQTVNVNTPKALVIVGGNQKKLNAMLAPKQLTDGQVVQP